MSESKLLKSIVVGAVSGAIISMFDRKTREHAIETTKKVKNTFVYYAKNREELQQFIEQKVEEAQELYDDLSGNINTIVSKLNEVKEIPNTIQSMVKDTKDVISNPSSKEW